MITQSHSLPGVRWDSSFPTSIVFGELRCPRKKWDLVMESFHQLCHVTPECLNLESLCSDAKWLLSSSNLFVGGTPNEAKQSCDLKAELFSPLCSTPLTAAWQEHENYPADLACSVSRSPLLLVPYEEASRQKGLSDKIPGANAMDTLGVLSALMKQGCKRRYIPEKSRSTDASKSRSLGADLRTCLREAKWDSLLHHFPPDSQV